VPDINSSTITLHARSPLEGASIKVEDTRLVENPELAIVSLAVPLGGDEAVEAALQSSLNLSRPAVGQLEYATGDSSTLANLSILSLQTDQLFLVFDYPEQDQALTRSQPVDLVKQAIGDVAYLTDQSDSWVVIDLEGSLALPALERICPLDLDEHVFTDTVVARTMMEYLSVIITRTQTNGFRLYSPRSTAASLWHAVHTSILNVSN